MHDSQTFEVGPVVAAVVGSRQGLTLYRNVAIDQLCSVVPVVEALDMGDDGFTVTFAFADDCGLPVSLLFQIPAIVFKDRFSRLGVREHLDPAFYSVEPRYSAKNYGMLQFYTQLAAWALRCFFSSEDTRSEG